MSKKHPNLPAAPAVVRLLPRGTSDSNAQPCLLLQNSGQSNNSHYQQCWAHRMDRALMGHDVGKLRSFHAAQESLWASSSISGDLLCAGP